MANDSSAKIAIESAQKAGKLIAQKLQEIIDSVVPCRHCGVTPVLSDTGGNIPYYELGCRCKDGVVVGSHNFIDTITTWNILNEVKT